MAFPDYKQNESWVAVAKYLYRDDWKEKLKVVDADDVGVGVGLDIGTTVGGDEGAEGDDGMSVLSGVGVDSGGIITILAYLNQITADEDDAPTSDALDFARKYVGTRMSESEGEDSDEDSDSDDEFSLNGRGRELIIGSETRAKGAVR